MSKAKLVSGIVGAVLSVPVVIKIGTMVSQKIIASAQNPADIVDEDTCRKHGYFWYGNACHKEPKPPYKYRCPLDGSEWDTYADLVAHYAKSHPGVSPPPEALLPPVRRFIPGLIGLEG